jgi:tetratricopeptide (TPR) repeat protein
MGWFRKTANDYLLKGTEQSLRGEYERAIETLSKALELDSQNAAAYWHRGIAFLESGQVEQALQDFGESLRLEPSALCYYNRALAWMSKGEVERALCDLDEAIRLDPQDAESYNLRAILYAKQGNLERAIAEIERAIDLGYENGWMNKAIFLEQIGRGEEALESWEQALEVNPKNTLVLCRRGLLLMRQGRRQEAQRDLEQAWKKRKELDAHWRHEVEQALKRLKDDAID